MYKSEGGLHHEQTEQIHAGGKPYYSERHRSAASCVYVGENRSGIYVGGTDAPSVKVLLLGIVVLGGGIVFVVRYLVLLLKEYYRKPEDSSEKEQ